MASRERDDAMAGLLKRSLEGDAGAGDGCPGPDILAAYFERSLDSNEIAHVELHLSECARCRQQLAALGRAEAEAPVTSVAGARHKVPRASWMWDWRWLAPVAAMLVITAIWATRRPTLTQIANHVAQPPASVAVSRPAQPVQPPPAPAPEKKAALSRVAPAPVVPPAPPPKVPPQSESIAVNSVDREKSAEVERSPLQSLQPSKSVQDLPLAGRNYIPLESLSKKAPAPQQQSNKDAANAPPRATDETVTVESEVATVQPTVVGAPGLPKTKNGAPAGAVGGAIASNTTNAKQEPAAANRLEMAEVVATTQEQRAASFIVQTPDPKIVWRIGNSGSIERSTDGGATWHGTLPKQNARYGAGSAPSANVCWLVGRDGSIRLTQDAKHWQTIPAPVQTDFIAITARDAWSATVTTADGRTFTTSDQGANWTAAK